MRYAAPTVSAAASGGGGTILGQRLQDHVAAGDRPVVVLLDEQRPHQAHDARLVGKNADDIGAPLDLLVQPLQRIRGVQRRAVRVRTRHERQHVVFRGIEHRRELGKAHGVTDAP